jgi:hypothetical protein
MQIEIPAAYGTVTENKLIDDGLNIIYGADRHTSIHSQRNLAHIYTDLATEYGLVVVGMEGAPNRVYNPSGESRLSKTQVHRFIDHDYSTKSLAAATIIEYSAALLGMEFISPASTVDHDLINIQLSLRHFIESSLQERVASSSNLIEYLRLKFSALPREYLGLLVPMFNDFTREKDPIHFDIFDSKLNYCRTESHVTAVEEETKLANQSLAFICRGAAHLKEFPDICRQKGIGYMVVEPVKMREDTIEAQEIYDKWRTEFGSAYLTQ